MAIMNSSFYKELMSIKVLDSQIKQSWKYSEHEVYKVTLVQSAKEILLQREIHH